MKVLPAEIPDILIIEPRVFFDGRGYFFESFSERAWTEETGLHGRFVQDTHSCSFKGVLRGLHYQLTRPQGKLVRCTVGEIFDVSVDIRKSSSTFSRWVGVRLSSENKRQVWIPEGFAHGYLALSDEAEVQYKTTGYYAPEHEKTILWCDPALAITWPWEGTPIVSDKDAAGLPFADAPYFS